MFTLSYRLPPLFFGSWRFTSKVFLIAGRLATPPPDTLGADHVWGTELVLILQQKFALEDVVGSHGCSLDASVRVTIAFLSDCHFLTG
jgi:hypothetical protein